MNPNLSDLGLGIQPLYQRARRSNAIAMHLRQLIASGQLKPGDQLPTETLLCQQFGVSRTTLREAIQMLRTTGLLEVTPGRGSFVRVPDLRQLLTDLTLASQHVPHGQQHQNTLVLMLLKDALGHLAQASASQRKQLYAFTLNRLAPPDDNAQAESQWLAHIGQLTGNPLHGLLLEILLAMGNTQRCQRFHNPDEVLRTIHIQMRTNGAIADGDAALAERVLSQYLTTTPAAAVLPARPPLSSPLAQVRAS